MGDCAERLKEIESDSVDLIATDPPYGYDFMHLDWDRDLPSLTALKECHRVLKPGSFAFILSSPRQDMLSHMIVRLSEAGFETGFTSIFWCYATGFPHGANLSKLIDKRANAEREVIGKGTGRTGEAIKNHKDLLGDDSYEWKGEFDITLPATPDAQKFNGAFCGFQPKPATEVIIVVMKPIATDSYVDQALSNGKGCTWLADCKIPYQNEEDMWEARNNVVMNTEGRTCYGSYNEYDKVPDEKGRFPANILICDNILHDGITKSTGGVANTEPSTTNTYGWAKTNTIYKSGAHHSDSGGFSRYFDLDAWFSEKFREELPKYAQQNYPYLIVAKPATSEKERCGKNEHPTVKPLKLMSYLIVMGSREGDVVLDPYCGSGTTLEAAHLLKRNFIGCELNEEYRSLIEARAHMRSYIKFEITDVKETVDYWMSDEPVVEEQIVKEIEVVEEIEVVMDTESDFCSCGSVDDWL